MNDEQRFAFDTWGFLTIEDALTPEQVAALKATVDEKGPDLHSQHSDRGGFWSQEFVDLLDVPAIAAILEEIYGGPRDDGEPPFRIDHINVHTHPPGVFGYGLHGGNRLLDAPAARVEEGGVGAEHVREAVAHGHLRDGDDGGRCPEGHQSRQ